MKFSVLIPEKPNGNAIVTCFESLHSQLVKAGEIHKPVSRLRINTQTKTIELETEEIPDGKETSEATT